MYVKKPPYNPYLPVGRCARPATPRPLRSVFYFVVVQRACDSETWYLSVRYRHLYLTVNASKL